MPRVTRRQLLGTTLAGVAGALAAFGFRRRRSGSAIDIPSNGGLLFDRVRVFDGGHWLDGERSVVVLNGKVATIDRAPVDRPGAQKYAGGAIFPGFVDAHVHLSFSTPQAVFAGGVTSVLDLGEPLAYAFADHTPLQFRAAGPLITAPGGYPTRSWGANGYGLEISSEAEAREAVAMLADRGAAMIKIAIEPGQGPVLDAETMSAVVHAARARRLKVAAHALGVASVRAALAAGVDVLAHTPVERLPGSVVTDAARRGVAVISTVRAFGDSTSTRANLAALAAAGCTVAYGTDLGNDGIRPGIDTAEIEILAEALGSVDAALAAATSVAGALAGSGGRLTVGGPGYLVWCPRFSGPADLRKDIRTVDGRP